MTALISRRIKVSLLKPIRAARGGGGGERDPGVCGRFRFSVRSEAWSDQSGGGSNRAGRSDEGARGAQPLSPHLRRRSPPDKKQGRGFPKRLQPHCPADSPVCRGV